jgi:UDP-N-acetylmuramoylalanine--D-glutamate ligase
MIFPEDFVNKKILIVGYGKTGKSVKKYLNKYNLNYSIWDDKTNIKVKYLDRNYYQKNFDYIVLSPGINIYQHKKKTFFLKNKKKIITDLDIFFSTKNKYKYVIGVTGTNGKSSFCNLLHNILKKNKISSKVIGNFGNAVLDENISSNQYCIIELSSYQLDYTKYMSLNVACIINLSPDHLERHKTFFNYEKAKLKIFSFLKKPDGNGFYHKKSFPKLNKKKYLKSFSNINANLIHQIFNKKISIPKGIFENSVLPHRNEFFLSKKNFNFINDSKSTNFDSTRYAIKKNKNIFIILGGLLKKGDNYYMKDLMSRIEGVNIYGDRVDALKKSLIAQKIKFNYFNNLKSLLKNLYLIEYLKNSKVKKKFTILFSPGAASFDQFKNFEDRGVKFKKYVNELFK